MKQLKINERCNQCGICVVKCPAYFAENSDGDVKVVSTAVNETEELRAAVASCPVKAIEIGKEIDSRKRVQEYIDKLNSFMSGITVTKEDIAFGTAYTRNVYVPSAGMSGYSYRSSSQAERAGYDAFVSRSYSQIDKLILERITDYRITEIKPYYTTNSESIYAKNNQKIADLLKAIQMVVGTDKLPADFCEVEVYPDTNSIVWKMLNRGEIISDNFVGIVKREFSYSASDYKTYIDWDDMEDYRGRDIYNYNATDASRELGSDLGNALGWAKSEIEEASLGYIKGIVDSYNKKLKSFLEKKSMVIGNVNLLVGDNAQSYTQSPIVASETSQVANQLCLPLLPQGEKIKLKSTATRYCSNDFKLLQIPSEFRFMEWEFKGIIKEVNYYNIKLVSGENTILVSLDDIIKI